VLRLLLNAMQYLPGGRGTRYSLKALQGDSCILHILCVQEHMKFTWQGCCYAAYQTHRMDCSVGLNEGITVLNKLVVTLGLESWQS
jgi:hypothetical protein